MERRRYNSDIYIYIFFLIHVEESWTASKWDIINKKLI